VWSHQRLAKGCFDHREAWFSRVVAVRRLSRLARPSWARASQFWGSGSANMPLRPGGEPVYRTGEAETGRTEREAGDRRGFRAVTVTVRLGESGRGVLLAR